MATAAAAQRQITAEELAERAREKRRRLGIPGANEGSSTRTPAADPVELQPTSAECTRCRREFSYQAVRVHGQELRRPAHCPACVEALEREKEARQRAEEAEAEERARAVRAGQIFELLESVGASPWEHGHATLDNFDTTESGPRPLRAAREFAAEVRAALRYDPVRGLYLFGPTGPGKTHLVVGVLRELLADPSIDPRSIVFDHAAELIARIQDTYNTRESTFAVLERRFDARLWVLDDLGTERPTDDVARHLTLIFTRRALRPTLVTCNLSPQDLEASRPELARVVSRLGPRYFQVVPVKGRDRRFDR